jgi:hypothetical protein
MRICIYSPLRTILKLIILENASVVRSHDESQKQNFFITILMGPAGNCTFI